MRILLRRVNLDESAIEAEAVIVANWRVAELEKRQAALQDKRDKALSCLAGFRAKSARKRRASADRILDPDDELRREIVEAAADDIRRLYETGELLRRSIEP